MTSQKMFLDITNNNSYAYYCDYVLVMLILGEHVKTELIVQIFRVAAVLLPG